VKAAACNNNANTKTIQTMANHKTWEDRFPITTDKEERQYWIIPVRKRLRQRSKFLDPNQLKLFNDGFEDPEV